MNLNLLLVLDAMMAERNVTRAGARLHMTQPAMSIALTRLRSAVGDQLFVRTRAGMVPTTRALELYASVAPGLRLIEAGLRENPQFDPQASTEEFRILLSDIGEVIYLPKLMRELRSVAPHVRISVKQLPFSEFPLALESAQVDLAIAHEPQLPAGYYQQSLFSDVYVCIVREDHPRLRDSLTLEQFCSEEHILVTPIWQAHFFDAALKSRGIERRVALNVGHYLALPSIVRHTDLLACLPSRAVAALAPLTDVKVLPLPFQAPQVTVRQYWHQRTHRDAAARWFRSMVVKALADHDDVPTLSEDST